MSYIRKILIALFLFVILGCNENTRPICIIGKIGVAKTHKDSIFHVFVSCLLINPSEKRYYLENEKVNDYPNLVKSDFIGVIEEDTLMFCRLNTFDFVEPKDTQILLLYVDKYKTRKTQDELIKKMYTFEIVNTDKKDDIKIIKNEKTRVFRYPDYANYLEGGFMINKREKGKEYDF